jgi:hypothetical protein
MALDLAVNIGNHVGMLAGHIEAFAGIGTKLE